MVSTEVLGGPRGLLWVFEGPPKEMSLNPLIIPSLLHSIAPLGAPLKGPFSLLRGPPIWGGPKGGPPQGSQRWVDEGPQTVNTKL